MEDKMANTYTTIQGDTWDQISYNVYGDESYVDLLMQNNFPLLDYCIFPSGVIVNIPDLPENSENEYPDWRSTNE
jgi:phage tail protein X